MLFTFVPNSHLPCLIDRILERVDAWVFKKHFKFSFVSTLRVWFTFLNLEEEFDRYVEDFMIDCPENEKLQQYCI